LLHELFPCPLRNVDLLGFVTYLMVVWCWWQENHEKRGKVEEMPQPSVDVSSISLPMCFFLLASTFFSSEKACSQLSEMLNVNLAVVAGE
jgi:hypothetical protein